MGEGVGYWAEGFSSPLAWSFTEDICNHEQHATANPNPGSVWGRWGTEYSVGTANWQGDRGLGLWELRAAGVCGLLRDGYWAGAEVGVPQLRGCA